MRTLLFLISFCLVNRQIPEYIDVKKDAFKKDQIEYIKLSELNFEMIKIDRSEQIEILTFSGGKNCDIDKYIIYRQYIGVRKSTGDTIRILSACEDYDIKKSTKIGYYIEELPQMYVQKNWVNNKLVAFNKENSYLEEREFKTCYGGLGFPVE